MIMTEKKLLCPKCGISNLFLKSKDSKSVINIYVLRDSTIVAKDGSEITSDFDKDTIFCLGCSWSGTVSQLVKFIM